MALYDFSCFATGISPVEFMRCSDELTGGIWSIVCSLLLYGVIVIGAYYKNRNWNKSLYGGSWSAIVINLFFIWPIKLVTYKILFLYLVMLIVSYISMKRDHSQ